MELVQSRRLWSKFLKSNGYKLVSCIGQGSFGDVYSVTCLTTGQPWAVKRLVARRDIQEDSYAMAEIEALACIQHPTIVSLKEILLCPRLACIVMEIAPEGNLEILVLQRRGQSPFSMADNSWSTIALRKLECCGFVQGDKCLVPDKNDLLPSELDRGIQVNCVVSITCDEFSTEPNSIDNEHNGQGLAACMAKEKEMLSLPLCSSSPPPPSPSCPTRALDPTFLSIAFVQIASALNFCHDLGVAHRDVNPSNVLVFRPDLVKLADFGLCFRCKDKDYDTENNNEKGCNALDNLCRDFLGRDHYTAPEVRRREPFLAKPADVWSLGCVLYFMLTADHPPLEYCDLLQGIADGLSKFIPAGYDVALAKKCLVTIGQACKFQVDERPSIKDIVALWDA